MTTQYYTYLVQIGKGKGSYKTKYKFTVKSIHSSQAWLYYQSILVHSGYKKRLLLDGNVIARELT